MSKFKHFVIGFLMVFSFSSVSHADILCVGDSLMYGFAPFLSEISKEKVINKAKISSGMVNQKFYNWNEKIKDLMVLHPRLVLLCVGTNDCLGFYNISFKSTLWSTAYKARLQYFYNQVKGKSKLIVFLPPVMRPEKLNSRLVFIKNVIEGFCKENNITYYDMNDGLSITGKFNELLREKDGIHINANGYKFLLHDIQKINLLN